MNFGPFISHRWFRSLLVINSLGVASIVLADDPPAPVPAAPAASGAPPAKTRQKAEPPTIDGLFTAATGGTSLASIPNTVPIVDGKGFLRLTFKVASDGELRVSIGTQRTVVKSLTKSNTNTSSFPVELDLSNISMKSPEQLTVTWAPVTDDKVIWEVSPPSTPIKVDIDTVPPRVTAVRLRGRPGGLSTLEVRFDDNDLGATAIESSKYTINRIISQSIVDDTQTTKAAPKPSTDGYSVLMDLGNLITGSYQLTLGAITDSHGNPLTAASQKFVFSSYPDAESGTHIPFPEYTQRHTRDKQSVFNPGDKVETRVARLYYFRDAHRVAQIINRNVKSYNRAAVSMAQQAAEDARTLADKKVAERKEREVAAINAAQASRAVERELAAARQELEELRAVYAQATQTAQATAAVVTPQMAVAKRKMDELVAKINALDATITADTEALAEYDSIIGMNDEEIAGLETQILELNGEIKGEEEVIATQTSMIADLNNQISKVGADSEAGKKYVAQRSDAFKKLDDANKLHDSATQQLAAAQNKKAPFTKAKAITSAKRKIVADRLNTQTTTRENLRKDLDTLSQSSTTNNSATTKPLTPLQTLSKEATREINVKIASLENALASKREIEQQKQIETNKAQEEEDRAKENQFRAEVAAATADPDTYVGGVPESVDPVTQVSISVIGEGLIQLRGPLRGINKIRTMINQIDSPVGQVKVGIFTVQVNGEHGDRMEKVATRIEGNIDLSRYLTNQSLGLLRRSIQEVAGLVVKSVDLEIRGNRQLDRDRRYLYAFFGRDFVDELYEMDSEFLHTENKVLSIHSMDTTNQSQAFFIMALAKNDVRQMILERFRHLIQCEMPCIEWDFRRSADMTRRIKHQKINTLEEVTFNVHQKYHFSNLHGFFNAWVDDTDAMTPMQREFIRLAQIFKSQMIAEVEYKQRVIERGLIEDQSDDSDDIEAKVKQVRSDAQDRFVSSLKGLVSSQDSIAKLTTAMSELMSGFSEFSTTIRDNRRDLSSELYNAIKNTKDGLTEEAVSMIKAHVREGDTNTAGLVQISQTMLKLSELDERGVNLGSTIDDVRTSQQWMDRYLTDVMAKGDLLPQSMSDTIEDMHKSVNKQQWSEESRPRVVITWLSLFLRVLGERDRRFGDRTPFEAVAVYIADAQELRPIIQTFLSAISDPKSRPEGLKKVYAELRSAIRKKYPDNSAIPVYIDKLIQNADPAFQSIVGTENQIARSKAVERRLRRDIDHRKLLEFLTDEQEEKYIELEEGCRSHISHVDNYLKRLAIALEDDFKVQFYDPAFAEVRRASREWDVNLGQVERTTILTNNRAFAKVSPQATMEFDLPKRDIMITEAMSGAKAIVNEYGNLLQDPTFLSVSGMLSGSPAVGGVAGKSAVPGLPGQGFGSPSVKNILPGQSTDTSEELMSQTGGPSRRFGSEFEKLIPDPAVYKIETGTGFEIRPVIQPDGHSIIYDFDYMYPTNIREPVRPDEKHLGRVKRHYIHTEVQTSSFELREISRYQVALKVSRTSRGVPLFEDIPGVGVLFRPQPSAESSLQQNIILGQSTVYPTLFDLMGLRWSKHVTDLDHVGLRDLEHVVRGRNMTIHDFTFDEGSKRVDDFLDIEGKDKNHLRPDLYRQQRKPSPYHPGGYQNRRLPDERDPTGHEFERRDGRPEEYRDPTFDSKYRVPVEQAPLRGQQIESIPISPGAASPPNTGFSVPRPVSALTDTRIQQVSGEQFETKPSAITRKPQLSSTTRPDQSTKSRATGLPVLGSKKKTAR